jgi:hypothetical protein
MGFRAVEAAPGRHRDEVTVSIKRAVGHLPRVRVSVHAEIAKALGWKQDMRLEPMVGDGPDRGLIKLRPAANAKSGFKLAASPGKYASSRLFVAFQAPPGSPGKYLMQTVEHTLNTVERSITLRVPWAETLKLRAAE